MTPRKGASHDRRGSQGASYDRRGGRGSAHDQRVRRATIAIGGRRAVAEAIRSGQARRVLVAKGSHSTEGLNAVIVEAERAPLALEYVDPSDVDALGLGDHQGVVAFVTPPRELDERGLRDSTFEPNALVVVLDGIEDPQNFGACARSAEAAGASLLVTRKKRAAPSTSAAIRSSAGALLHLRVARVANLVRTIELLQGRGFFAVGLDHRATTDVNVAEAPPHPLALVVGSEEAGLSRLVRERCDLLVAIPMRGRTESLNAAAALAVVLFGYALRPPG